MEETEGIFAGPVADVRGGGIGCAVTGGGKSPNRESFAIAPLEAPGKTPTAATLPMTARPMKYV